MQTRACPGVLLPLESKLKLKVRPKIYQLELKLKVDGYYILLALIPKPSPLLVFDLLQYASMEEEGTRKILSCVWR